MPPEILRDILIALIAAAPALIKSYFDGKAQKKENDRLQMEIGKLQDENTKLHTEIDGLVKVLGESDEKVTVLQHAYDFLRAQYDGLLNKYEVLQAQYSALKAENELLKTKLTQVGRDVKKQTGGLPKDC